MLTDTLLRNLKATEKVQKISDGGGLYIHVTTKGVKLWRMNYRYGNRQKTLSFGQYPYISLKASREMRNEAKELLARGIDPGAHKKAMKEAQKAKSENGFEIIAREYHDKQKNVWSDGYSRKQLASLVNDVFPIIGSIPIQEITAPILLDVLRRIEKRGAIDATHRVLQLCGCIFRYAISTGRIERNIAGDLKGALPNVKSKHYAAITEPKAVGQLLRDIDTYHSRGVVVSSALSILPYVFVRNSELAKATWDEFNLDTAEWHIPAERMKMGKIHIVPLARQVIDILKNLYQYTGNGKYLFPSMRGDARPISNVTLLRALQTMGYNGDTMTVHGFRSMASTLLNGKGYNRDWIERQLAHIEANSVRNSYNHADYLEDRKRMMQEWADYLDELREAK